MLARMRLLAISSVALLALAACGDDGGSTPPIDGAPNEDSQSGTDAAIDAAAGTFTLTSTAYAEGGVIPLAHVCMQQNGMDQSPPLAWTNPPAGTMSFAIVFIDKSFNDYIHSIIYDIPASVTALPQDVDKMYSPPDVPGAHQTTAFDNSTRGYRGPCPPDMHTYEFAIYAINATTLPGSMMSTTKMQALTAITANSLGVARLTGTHTPP